MLYVNEISTGIIDMPLYVLPVQHRFLFDEGTI